MTILEGQILGVFAQVLRRHAEAVSGAYRLYRGTATDDEKLADCMAVMERQIHRLQDCIDALGDEPEDA